MAPVVLLSHRIKVQHITKRQGPPMLGLSRWEGWAPDLVDRHITLVHDL